MSNSGQRIVIIGGAGFQGSHLAERWLELGHRITILNTFSEEALANITSLANRVTVVWGSITDPEIVEKTVRGHDVVVHLAARIHVDESIDNPTSYTLVNVLGTHNVLEAVRKIGSRLIYASSCEVYGFHSEGATPETAELRPHSPYAASKAAADRMCFAYWKTYHCNVTIVRPCNIYGPRQKSGRGGAVIPIFVDRALGLQDLIVHGTGEQRREYMHVDDLVSAYDKILNTTDLQGEAVNFGTGETPSIKEVAHFIASKLGTSVQYGPGRAGEVEGFVLDCSKARQLGFTPAVRFWEGLERYIEWKMSLSSVKKSSL